MSEQSDARTELSEEQIKELRRVDEQSGLESAIRQATMYRGEQHRVASEGFVTRALRAADLIEQDRKVVHSEFEDLWMLTEVDSDE